MGHVENWLKGLWMEEGSKEMGAVFQVKVMVAGTRVQMVLI